MVEKYLKTNICSLPWNGIEISPDGGAKPCCLYREAIPDVKVYNNSLEEIQNHSYMKELRQKFLNGERPDACTSCWQEEDAGKVSKRMNMFYKMKDTMSDWTPNSEPKLEYIDFKLGNVCNLKCRICGSWSSSKWAQEEIDISDGDNPVARRNLKEGGWPKRQPQFFDDVKQYLNHAKYFEFTGGEPFMIPNHFKVLKYCVVNNLAKDIDIHYNTNGTQLPDPEIFTLLGHFKRVEVAFSIDDIGAQFEYQRHPANWREVSSNLVKWKEQHKGRMEFQICSTINIFNVFSLAKLALWVKQYNPKYFHINTLFNPDEFNIQGLPRQVKDIVMDRYHMMKDFQPTLRFMNQQDLDSDALRKSRRERIHKSDQYRKENFADVFPLLNKVLKVYD